MSIRNFITALCGAALLLTPSHPVFAQNSGELSNIVVELQEAESKIDSVEAKCTKTMKMSEGLFTAIQSDLRKLGVAQSKLPDKDQYDADIYVAISGSRYRVEGEGDGLAPPTVIYNGSKTYHVTPKSSQSLKSFQQVTETSGGAAAFPTFSRGENYRECGSPIFLKEAIFVSLERKKILNWERCTRLAGRTNLFKKEICGFGSLKISVTYVFAQKRYLIREMLKTSLK